MGGLGLGIHTHLTVRKNDIVVHTFSILHDSVREIKRTSMDSHRSVHNSASSIMRFNRVGFLSIEIFGDKGHMLLARSFGEHISHSVFWLDVSHLLTVPSTDDHVALV